MAPRRAAQEADPRFSRPAALELVNQKVASHLGMEAGAPQVKSQTLSQRTPTEEERRSEFSDSSLPGREAARIPFTGSTGRLLLYIVRHYFHPGRAAEGIPIDQAVNSW